MHVYTGNGKGKTTAAIGLAIRALGAGQKVAFFQFMKAEGYSEHNVFKTLAPGLAHFTVGKPFFIIKQGAVSDDELKKITVNYVAFPPGNPPADYVDLVIAGMDQATEIMSAGTHDLVVLDELNCALHFELISWATVEQALDKRASTTEIVITGRGAPGALLERADLVTEMLEIKHYYNEGVTARIGVEN